MAGKVNLGAGFGSQVHKQSTEQRHAEELHAASVLDTNAAPEDAGEIFAAMDAATDDMEQNRTRHEAELSNSTIPALKSLAAALKTARAQEPSVTREVPSMGMSKDMGFGATP